MTPRATSGANASTATTPATKPPMVGSTDSSNVSAICTRDTAPGSSTTVDMKVCTTCKQMKDKKVMYISLKKELAGRKDDAWKCKACNALNSRINRLRESGYDDLVDGFQEMETNTREQFMVRASNMFRAELAKQLNEAYHPNLID